MAEVKKMFIDGEWVLSSSGDSYTLINPATGEPLAEVTKATREDTQRAIAAAKRAFYEDGWCDVEPLKRAELMNAFADEMEALGKLPVKA